MKSRTFLPACVILFAVSLLLAIPFTASAQSSPPDTSQATKLIDQVGDSLDTHNASKVTIKQGVWGTVFLWQGNFMPSTDPPGRTGGTISPVAREVYIYDIATTDDVTRSGSFFTDVHTPLVAEVDSDKDGFFQVELPPGRYSIFVKEDEGLFANTFDNLGFIQPITIKDGQVIQYDLNVDYGAAR